MAEKHVFQLIDIGKSIKTKERSKEILQGINFTVGEGEFVCIMGSTGCGKSTLMRLLCGIDKYDEGIMFYKGSEIKNGMRKDMLKDIGVAYQSDNLFEWQTVTKNIENPINVFKLKKSMNVSERMEKMLDLTGLKNYRNCYPKELSGGMRQRCAFGRALAHDPEVLLLDQPFGALDAITRKILGIQLLKIWHESGKTVVMVTNNVQEALMLAQKVVILSPAPAKVLEIVENPLTYEERTSDLAENEKFLALSERLNQLVHMQTA